MDLGSNDTSNDFSYDDGSQDYEPSVASSSQTVRELNSLVQDLDLPTFMGHVNELEANRLKNANANATEPLLDTDDNAENETSNDIVNAIDEVDEGWVNTVIERQIRQQEEEDADARGRLTAPPAEVRLRRQKSNQNNKSQLADEIRTKQLKLIDQQIELQNVLIENAKIAKEEAQERLKHIKNQREMTDMELEEKKKEKTQ